MVWSTYIWLFVRLLSGAVPGCVELLISDLPDPLIVAAPWSKWTTLAVNSEVMI